MATGTSEVVGSPIEMVIGQARAWDLILEDACASPSSPSNTIYDLSDGSSAAALLSGLATIASTTFTSQLVTPTSGYAGKTLRLWYWYTCSGNTLSEYLDIEVRAVTDTTI